MTSQIKKGKRYLVNGYWTLVSTASALLISLQPIMADTIWDRFSKIMRDVYGQLAGISTIVAVTAAAVALLVRMISRNQRAVDEATSNIHKEDVQRAIRIGACNVYHMCVHNLVHERSADILKGLYKSAVFTLQAIAFLQTGSYKKKKTDLLPLLQEKDQNILRTSIELKEKNSLSFEEILQFSDLLLNWSSKWIREVR